MTAWIEIIFIAFGLVYFVLSRKKSCFFALLMYLILFVFLRSPVSIDAFFIHWSSPFHIVLSWAAKVWLLCVGLSHILSGIRPEPQKIQIGLWLCSLSIITGMYWAFDAPNWGELWQWDGIETLSLCSFLSLYGLKNSREDKLPAYLCVFMVVVQNIALYGTGLMGEISRHSYAEVSSNALILTISQIMWFLFVVGLGVLRRARKREYLEESCTLEKGIFGVIRQSSLIVLAGISICVITGVLPAGVENSVIKYIYYGVFTIILAGMSNWNSSHSRAAAFCAVITLWIPGILPGDSETELAEIGGSENRAELLGIRAENRGEHIHYLAEIRYGSSFADIEMDGYETGFYPSGHVDVLNSGIVRIWGVDYRANRGVRLLTRNITLDRLYEVWVLFLLILSVVVFIAQNHSHQKLKDSEQGSGSSEPPCVCAENG